jgi:hypothetical protein
LKPGRGPPDAGKRNAGRAPGGFVESGQQASRQHTTSERHWIVVAVKPDGRRVVVGACPTRAAAERWAKLLREFSMFVGGDAVVEHVGERRS